MATEFHKCSMGRNSGVESIYTVCTYMHMIYTQDFVNYFAVKYPFMH